MSAPRSPASRGPLDKDAKPSVPVLAKLLGQSGFAPADAVITRSGAAPRLCPTIVQGDAARGSVLSRLLGLDRRLGEQ